MISHKMFDSSCFNLNQQSSDPRWYAVHICANQEKNVAAQLAGRDIEYFLPLFQSVRRWSDRRVVLDLPLFPGYIFVRISLLDRLQVLQIPRVAQIVGFQGSPSPLPDEEIAALRNGIGKSQRVEPHPYLAAGRRVRIVCGPFDGVEGILVRRKNLFRVVVSLELIMRSVSIEVDESSIEAVAERNVPGPIVMASNSSAAGSHF